MKKLIKPLLLLIIAIIAYSTVFAKEQKPAHFIYMNIDIKNDTLMYNDTINISLQKGKYYDNSDYTNKAFTVCIYDDNDNYIEIGYGDFYNSTDTILQAVLNENFFKDGLDFISSANIQVNRKLPVGIENNYIYATFDSLYIRSSSVELILPAIVYPNLNFNISATTNLHSPIKTFQINLIDTVLDELIAGSNKYIPNNKQISWKINFDFWKKYYSNKHNLVFEVSDSLTGYKFDCNSSIHIKTGEANLSYENVFRDELFTLNIVPTGINMPESQLFLNDTPIELDLIDGKTDYIFPLQTFFSDSNIINQDTFVWRLLYKSKLLATDNPERLIGVSTPFAPQVKNIIHFKPIEITNIKKGYTIDWEVSPVYQGNIDDRFALLMVGNNRTFIDSTWLHSNSYKIKYYDMVNIMPYNQMIHCIAQSEKILGTSNQFLITDIDSINHLLQDSIISLHQKIAGMVEENDTMLILSVWESCDTTHIIEIDTLMKTKVVCYVDSQERLKITIPLLLYHAKNIEVFAVTGGLIQTIHIQSIYPTDYTTELIADVSILSKGSYYARIGISDENYYFKFIKE